jgi:8-oxo-dGTP diphosphatase
LSEESGLRGRIIRALWTLQHPDRRAHYYLVSAHGPLRLGGPELALQSPTNQHRPAWVPVSEVARANLQPVELAPLLADLAQHQGRTTDG